MAADPAAGYLLRRKSAPAPVAALEERFLRRPAWRQGDIIALKIYSANI
ncbi:hypothetical protein [Klebsiella pneumoniae]|nr:hypothetical protein [Klebsiella pneumoniae]